MFAVLLCMCKQFYVANSVIDIPDPVKCHQFHHRRYVVDVFCHLLFLLPTLFIITIYWYCHRKTLTRISALNCENVCQGVCVCASAGIWVCMSIVRLANINCHLPYFNACMAYLKINWSKSVRSFVHSMPLFHNA